MNSVISFWLGKYLLSAVTLLGWDPQVCSKRWNLIVAELRRRLLLNEANDASVAFRFVQSIVVSILIHFYCCYHIILGWGLMETWSMRRSYLNALQRLSFGFRWLLLFRTVSVWGNLYDIDNYPNKGYDQEENERLKRRRMVLFWVLYEYSCNLSVENGWLEHVTSLHRNVEEAGWAVKTHLKEPLRRCELREINRSMRTHADSVNLKIGVTDETDSYLILRWVFKVRVLV